MTDVPTSNAADRRARLLAVKLHALVREHTGAAEPDLVTSPFPLGAALRVGDDGWVLLDEPRDDGRGLGAALIWANRAGAQSLALAAEQGAGVLARRAAAFALPTCVWAVDGRSLREATPAPVLTPTEPPAAHLRFAGDIKATGADPVVEHGVLTGEVRGLEVCRVVDADGPDGRVVRLEVGAGVHDREAFAIMHGDVPTHDALAGVVAAVAEVRSIDSPAHPLNRLSPERFVRWRLQQEPWLVDLASVEPAPPPVPKRNLSDRMPCSAIGRRLDGSAVVLVCSVGVDLDVIPYAADARLAASQARLGGPGVGDIDRDVDVMVVLPPRDVVPATQELAGLLRQPVALVSLPSD